MRKAGASGRLAVLVATLLASSARGAVTFEARHAAAGVHRPTGLVPVFVRLTGDDESRRLRVVSGTMSREVELAPHAVKELTFFAPGGNQRNFPVALLSARGEKLTEVAVTSVPVPRTVPVVGIVGAHPAGWGTLRNDDKHPLRVVHLKPSELSEDPLAFAALDAMLLVNPLPGSLSPERVDAIARWQERGGHVILAVNDTGAEISRFTSIRIARVSWRRDLPEFPASEPIGVATLAGGNAFLSDGAEVLGAREWRGAGSATVIGLDPTHRALSGDDALASLWRKEVAFVRPVLAEEAGPVANGYPNYAYGGGYFPGLDGGVTLHGVVAQSFVEAQGISPPPRALLALLLLAYLVAIGPVDYFVLRKYRRLGLTWATYPALLVLFSCGAYAAANATKSVDALRVVAIRDLLPKSGLFHEEVDTSLFMGHGGKYRLKLQPASGLALPTELDTDRYMTRRVVPSGASYLEGEGTVEATLPKWTPLLSRGIHDLPAEPGARLEAALTVAEARVSGRLVPHLSLGRDFDDSWLVIRASDSATVSIALGGQRDGVPTVLRSEAGTALSGATPQTTTFAGRLLGASAARLVAYERNRRGPLLPAEPDDFSRLLGSGGALFVAHVRGASNPIAVEGGRPPVTEDVYVRVPIPPEEVRR